MIRKHAQINHVEETVNVKWCVSKVPQYICLKFVFQFNAFSFNFLYFKMAR